MIISDRLKLISDLVTDVHSIVDVGTDHGYVPIYLIKNKRIKRAIASDINRGPVEKAQKNVESHNFQGKISCRLGGGLKTVKIKEVDAAVIAGMGGNLIRDIIEESKEVFKELKYVIVQPVQNPEVLREHIYKSGYKIIDEAIIKDEEKYYEIMKIAYDTEKKEVDPIFYEISEKLLQKKNPLYKEYLEFKYNKYENIYNNIKEDTEGALRRKDEIREKLIKLKEFLQWL